MFVTLMALMTVASASDFAGISEKISVRNTDMATILEQSAVVVEGSIVEVRPETWLGPSGPSQVLVWRIAVQNELLGTVQNGILDVAMDSELPPNVEPGTRVLVMANARTLYLPSFIEGRAETFAVFPSYNDLLVPTVIGSIYHTYEMNGELHWSSPEIQDGADWLPESRDEIFSIAWDDLLDLVRSEIALKCSSCGSTVPGAALDSGE